MVAKNNIVPYCAFIGVRISRLMVAKKVLFARFASSAYCLAVCSSSINWRRSLMTICTLRTWFVPTPCQVRPLRNGDHSTELIEWTN